MKLHGRSLRAGILLRVVLCLAVLGLVGGYLFILRPAKTFRCADCSVILVSIDTLRPDHLGCYGYGRPTSPEIDDFRDDAVLFQTAVAQAPSTAPSHGSMLTSLIPIAHGAFVTKKSKINERVPTMAEILKSRQFRTASFNGGGQIQSTFGFDRGFEIYKSFSGSSYTDEKLSDRVDEGVQWLSGLAHNEQFFLFLHSYDIHHPYAPEPDDLKLLQPGYEGPLQLPITGKTLNKINSGKLRISRADRGYIVSAYDAEIRSASRAFGKLVDYLKASGRYDKTLIVLTSDHGEEFGEHGFMGWHSHTLYDELLRVPLLIKYPLQQNAGTSVEQQVRSIDILPTALEVLGLPSAPHFQGRSLLTMSRFGIDSEFDRYAISQKDSKKEWPPTSVRTMEWKFYKKMLFRLSLNPPEIKDLSEKYPQPAAELREVMERAKGATDASSEGGAELAPEVLDQLETLGYL